MLCCVHNMQTIQYQVTHHYICSSYVLLLHAQVCWDGGDLICCDVCPAAYHAECLGQDIAHLTSRNHWACPHHSCATCGRGPQASGGLLFRCGIWKQTKCGCLWFKRQWSGIYLSHVLDSRVVPSRLGIELTVFVPTGVNYKLAASAGGKYDAVTV
jgi:hypothetical protein